MGISRSLFSMTEIDEKSVPGHIVKKVVFVFDQKPAAGQICPQLPIKHLERLLYTAGEHAEHHREFLHRRFGVPVATNTVVALASGLLFGLTGNKIFIGAAVGASLWHTIALMATIAKHLAQN